MLVSFYKNREKQQFYWSIYVDVKSTHWISATRNNIYNRDVFYKSLSATRNLTSWWHFFYLRCSF